MEEVDEAQDEEEEQQMVALPRGSYFWTLELFLSSFFLFLFLFLFLFFFLFLFSESTVIKFV